MLDKGLPLAVRDLVPLEVVALLLYYLQVENPAANQTIRIWIQDVKIGYPLKEDGSRETRLLPHECRERGISYLPVVLVTTSYTAPLIAYIAHQVNDGKVIVTERNLGQLPIMVGSNRCHLSRMTPPELVACGEEVYELGGYFICNGLERLIRLLQVPRRHVIMALDRSSFIKRGPQYSSLGCQMKCVREDMSSVTLTLHYLRDGRCNLRWSINKQEFLVPVLLILKALKDCSDREIYDHLMRGDSTNTFLSDRLELLLRESKSMHL